MALREFQQNIQDLTAMQSASPMSALRNAFGRSHLSENEVSFIHGLTRFNDNLELLGQQSGSIESVIERGAKLARTITEASDAVKERSKRSFNTIMFLTLLDQHIADLERDLAQTRSYFEYKYGEAWREEVALKVLDEDEMPERKPGESLADYRERVERAIVDKVCDKDGNLKPEYRDHPDAEHLGRLGKQIRDIDKAKATRQRAIEIQNDPNLSDTEKAVKQQENLEGSGLNETNHFQAAFATGSAQDQAAIAVKDENRDDVAQTASLDSDDGLFGSYLPS